MTQGDLTAWIGVTIAAVSGIYGTYRARKKQRKEAALERAVAIRLEKAEREDELKAHLKPIETKIAELAKSQGDQKTHLVAISRGQILIEKDQALLALAQKTHDENDDERFEAHDKRLMNVEQAFQTVLIHLEKLPTLEEISTTIRALLAGGR